ncbi:Putative membrane protein [Propionibacterium freudenreichii]|jgi:hypothetical protein|nr:Putative membrane protein [Propionibacterium freudenreichii]
MTTAMPDSSATLTKSTHSQRDLLHGIVLAGMVVIGSLIPLIFNHNFYFYADSAEGAYGQWYELGTQLRSGVWPLMNPSAWMAGNYAAEGQWGLWNPIVLLIGVIVSMAGNALVVTTLVKIFFLVVGATGLYALSRSFGAHARWAFVAGLAGPFAGFTLFMDASSWVTNEMVWAFSAWTFWALRRFLVDHKSIFPAVVTGYLLVTVGYLEGTIILVLFYCALLIDAIVRKNWRTIRRTLLIGVIHGLFAVTVYLPGVLSASVTQRSNQISNDGFMVLTGSGLATSTIGFATPALKGWWGDFTMLPLLYIAWFLPLVFLISGHRAKLMVTRLSPLLIFGLLVLARATAPAQVGPIRFPVRVTPWLAMVAIVAVIVLFDRARSKRPGGPRLAAMLVFVVFGSWLAFSATPNSISYPSAVVHVIAYVVALWFIWWWCRNQSNATTLRTTDRARHLVLPLVTVLVCGLVLVLQARTFAPLVNSRSDYPAEAAVYREPLPEGQGDGVIVGDPLATNASFWGETNFGNSWYLDNVKVQNVYTPVGFQNYASDLCLLYDGRSCTGLLDHLFSLDPTSGRPLVDLLSIDTVQAVASPELTIDQLKARPVPHGWRLAQVGQHTVTWVRLDPGTPAGEAAWSSPDVTITQGGNNNLTSTVHVDAVGPQGGDIVFSRLAWPGYRADNASLNDPYRGYLLSVHVTAADIGKDVTVSFRPPGWNIEIAAFGSGWALAAVAMITVALRQKRAVRRSPHA